MTKARKNQNPERIADDNTSLDVFLLKDKSLTYLDNLPELDGLAEEIIENRLWRGAGDVRRVAPRAGPSRGLRGQATTQPAVHFYAAAPVHFHAAVDIPGVGIITATALAASIPDPAVFKTGRQFAAFLGLVPRRDSSGGKDRLGGISKMGDRYLRRPLVLGATSVLRRVGNNTSATGACVRGLLERKPSRVVTVAIANKTARIAWAVLARGETYLAPRAA